MLPAIADPALRDVAAALLDHVTAEVLPQLNQLPKQICHSDLNRHNLLIELDNPDHITGILDFGDMVRTPRICDLAVAAAYHFHDEESLPQLVSLVQGYASLSPLTAAELELLPWLMQIRMLASITISSWRAARYPDNARYILRNATAARGGLQAMQALNPQLLRDELRKAAGL